MKRITRITQERHDCSVATEYVAHIYLNDGTQFCGGCTLQLPEIYYNGGFDQQRAKEAALGNAMNEMLKYHLGRYADDYSYKDALNRTQADMQSLQEYTERLSLMCNQLAYENGKLTLELERRDEQCPMRHK